MPELPDIVVYLEALESRILNETLEQAHLKSPFVLRSVLPPLSLVEGRRVRSLSRIGKRIVMGFDGDLFLVIHLMVARRLRWANRARPKPTKTHLAEFHFPNGVLALVEAGTKKRASLHVVQGEAELTAHDRGGLGVLGAGVDEFKKAILSENHTLKRALTDPRILSGVGNAYSDEILHAARLSPFKLTRQLVDNEIVRLHKATRATLRSWIERLREQVGSGFPTKVTAFRDGMAVHGRYKEPCPSCASPVQRIVYAHNEVNYCARCQTGGKLLMDRALSRLLKSDWPRTIDDLEEQVRG